MEILKRIIENILLAIYQPFGFALIMAILLTALNLYIREKGWKEVLRHYILTMKKEKRIRKQFFLDLYVCLLLFKTLLNRDVWMSPLSDVIGVWGIYDNRGQLTTEVIENFVMFIPLVVLLFWSFQEEILGNKIYIWSIIKLSLIIAFCFSMSIEILQLILRLGTFQLSDLFYNTLGGFFGGIIYWGCYNIGNWRKTEKVIKKYND